MQVSTSALSAFHHLVNNDEKLYPVNPLAKEFQVSHLLEYCSQLFHRMSSKLVRFLYNDLIRRRIANKNAVFLRRRIGFSALL